LYSPAGPAVPDALDHNENAGPIIVYRNASRAAAENANITEHAPRPLVLKPGERSLPGRSS